MKEFFKKNWWLLVIVILALIKFAIGTPEYNPGNSNNDNNGSIFNRDNGIFDQDNEFFNRDNKQPDDHKPSDDSNATMNQNNVFLAARDRGISKRLLGDVLIINILVDDGDSSWTQNAMDSYFNSLHKAARTLEDSARSYGADLTVDTAYITYEMPKGTIPRNDEYMRLNSFLEGFLKAQGVRGLSELEDYHKENNHSGKQYDEVCYVFTVAKEGRSYAVTLEFSNDDKANEYACVFIDAYPDHAIAHEVLHLFGAADLYYSDEIMNTTQTYLGESIMKTKTMRVDGLTAYLVGWKNSLTSDEKGFLQATDSFSKKEFYDLRSNAGLIDILDLGDKIKIGKGEASGKPSKLKKIS